MKEFITLVLVISSLLSICSCSKSLLDDQEERSYPFFVNPPMRVDTLRVLAVGNSFTEDALWYLNKIVQASGCDMNRICVYQLISSSKSVKYWSDKYTSGDTVAIGRKTGNIKMGKTRSTFPDIIQQPWDLVVFQQLSKYSHEYNTIEEDLYKLVSNIQNDCQDRCVSFAWHSTWSYWDGFTNSGPHGEKGWKEIVSVSDDVVKKVGVDIVIPSGTAIQNARNTLLNTNHALTRDGYHMAYGVGRYIVACTWYETLFEPMFGISVLKNTSRISITEKEKETTTYEAVPVTDDNAELCQICALEAVRDKHSIFKPEL